jgi:multiple sugar transport system ATP-binding protein
MFVAGFFGSRAMNLCLCQLGTNGLVSLGGVDVELPPGTRSRLGDEVVVGLRPESLEVGADGIAASIEVVDEIGADACVFTAAEVGGEDTKLVARVEARRAPERGERALLRPRPGEAHLFDPQTGARLTMS